MNDLEQFINKLINKLVNPMNWSGYVDVKTEADETNNEIIITFSTIYTFTQKLIYKIKYKEV